MTSDVPNVRCNDVPNPTERREKALDAAIREPLSQMGEYVPLPSEKGTTQNVFRTFASKPSPESGPDSLLCAEFARQRDCFTEMRSGSEKGSYLRRIDGCINQL